ncbi:hypothetical protein ColTof4_12584 [Colletotrichum tofieldiae]|uniref:Uncharacterized protein n=1 Tax=Colletotrichum tofieldiae TaxID=708197 RepID=A0A166MKY7_9PEZI|nr:hypothetical protein CT0861_01837 [Colletotrichum tofieldiae]GKT59123.1 hypothetical protein ColTof3_06462 [Colletotrichum tofieldiae]GKT80161.1 hypothetical protein ColTof4_12584 [Colletotrichum tofieldiae]GKT85274.1 hypothetical protein Ct61P_03124 [Colletotrichum tofieldiae]
MAAPYDATIKFREGTPRTFSPDPDTHRGRKRDRSLTRCDLEATHYGGTGESSTLRGRPRRRSTSPVVLSSRASSRAIPSTSASPMRKGSLRMVLLDRRRCQSPSRSRSPNQQQAPRRRRHRTRSRSRTHAKEMYQVKDQLPRPRQEQLYKKASTSAQDQ